MKVLKKPSVKNSITHGFEQRKRVVELYHAGFSSRKIAKLLHLDDSSVRLWLRRYRSNGMESLQPYWRNPSHGTNASKREEKERKFQPAFPAYGDTLESVLSIARRYDFNYHSFKYYIEHYHPELVARRRHLSAVNTRIKNQ